MYLHVLTRRIGRALVGLGFPGREYHTDHDDHAGRRCLIVVLLVATLPLFACLAQHSPARQGTDTPCPCDTASMIPSVHAIFCMCLEAPREIIADYEQLRYRPMPFPLRCMVRNRAASSSDSVFLELEIHARSGVSNDLVLHPSSGPGGKRRSPTHAALRGGEADTITWMLWHPIALVAHEYTLLVRVWSKGAESIVDSVALVIPSIEGVVLDPTLTLPDSLQYLESEDRYTPNPFTVTLTCVNRGGDDALGASAFLSLPKNVVLADTSQRLHVQLPTPLHPWSPGDTVPRVSWTLRYVDTTYAPSPLSVAVVVGAIASNGTPLDSVRRSASITLQPPIPRLEVVQHLTLPDSIAATPDRRALTPNPFTATFALRNAGARTYDGLSIITLSTETNEGLIFDASTPAVRSFEPGFHAGDTLRVSWIIRVEPRRKRRVVWLNVIAYMKDGTLWPFCQRLLLIDAVDTTTTGLPHEGVLPRTPAFVVAPHPVTDVAQITLSTDARRGTLTLSDLLGRIVDTRALDAIHPGAILHIDLSDQPRGIYIVHLQHDGKTHTARILKR